jgi:ABC-type Mn2+/Zn2+ transport system permease subunit
MMAVGVLVAVGSGTAGLYLSYYAGTAAGASIAGVLVLVHLAVLIVSRMLGRA